MFFRPNIEKLRAKGKVDKLIKIVQSRTDYDTRRLAAGALGTLKDARAVEPLCGLLHSAGSRIRIEAAEALGSIGDKKAAAELIKCLKSEVEELRIAAAEALGNIRAEEALPHLAELAKSRIPALKKSAICAIGMIGVEQSVKILNRLFWEESEESKIDIVAAFKNIKAQSAIDALIRIYQSSSIQIRETAAGVLSQLGWKPDKEHADQWIASSEEIKSIPIPEKLQKLIDSKSDLPAIPEIVIKLNGLLSDPDVTLKDIGNLIKTEPSLSARAVKTANSAYFSRGAIEISDVQTAVTRLGVFQIRNLVFAFSLIKQFEAAKLIDRRKFWTHSLVAAQIAKALSKIIKQSEEEQEIAYMAALMHDIGIVVLMNIAPQAYERFLRTIVGNKICVPNFSLCREEDDAIGTDHAKIGAAYIDRWWPVDIKIVQAVLHHHQSPDKEKLPLLSKIVILANQYCHSIGLDNGVNFVVQPEPFDEQKFALIGMNDTQIKEFSQAADNEVEAAKMILSFE